MRRALPSLVARAAVAAAVLAAGPAHADRPASSGLYTEAGLGAAGFLGEARGWSRIGPTLEIRVGYDLWSWLSLGVALTASSHEATVPPPPEGEWYQLYQGRADARLGFRVGGVAAFAEGGAGAAYISSNVLAKVGVLDPGERFTPAFAAGAGLEYQLHNRHYACGIAGGYWMLPAFDAVQGVEARLYLRYTYGGAH